MKIEQVLETYDQFYADEYDSTFLLDVWTNASVAFQIELLAKELQGARNWLDVCCGTGYMLSQFPNVDRAGLDISPAMLEKAGKRNPGVALFRGDHRVPRPEWEGYWDIVSCMWWAYCMLESMSEIRDLVGQLARWTSPAGGVFLPLCNPRKFDRENIKIPYIDPKVPGRIMITGITWTWIQENGKRHDEVVSPQVEHMVAMFSEHFEDVRVIEGPIDKIGEGWRVQDVLIARRKRARPPDPSRKLFEVDREPTGSFEWQLRSAPGNVAGTEYPTLEDVGHVRVVFEQLEKTEPWDVQISRRGCVLETGVEYRLCFSARADQAREIAFGVALAEEPWHGLGLYATVMLEPDWTAIERVFIASASAASVRVHIDLAQSLASVEIRNVSLVRIPGVQGPSAGGLSGAETSDSA